MNKRTWIPAVITLVLGVSAGYWWADTGTSPVDNEFAVNGERKILFYRNPMNPDVTSPVPAKGSMGMDYVPVYADGDAGTDEPAGTVRIDPTTVQNIGVRTAIVKRGTISKTIRTVGRVDYDEERLARLHPKTEGWIEELFINKTGERISADAILLNFYAPQLVSTQQEYLLALQNLDNLRASPYDDIRRGAEELVRITRQRLKFFDVPEHQIVELEQNRTIMKLLHIHSPFAGVVIHIGAREGEYVTPQTELYRIVDLSRIWVYADLYEDELPWVSVDDPVEITVAALPGRKFHGKVTYLYPYAESKTRTVKARLEFDNPDFLLLPDMFADVTIFADRREDALMVPSEALVRSGKRKLIFVVGEPGKFIPTEVTVGISADGVMEILSGLREGDEVVTSSQFLIDSESKLREATAKMLDAGRQKNGNAPEHQQ